MKKMLLKKNVFFISIFSMLFFCLMAPQSFSAPKSSKSAPKSAPRTAKSESVSYSTVPFDDTWKSLPQSYNGHDIVAVHKSLSKILEIKKDEFETEEQYKERRKKAWQKTIIGNMNADDKFAFVLDNPQKEYDAENSRFIFEIKRFEHNGVILKDFRVGDDEFKEKKLKEYIKNEKIKRRIQGKDTWQTDMAGAYMGALVQAGGIREIFTIDFSKENWEMVNKIVVDMPPDVARKTNDYIRILFVGSISGYTPRLENFGFVNYYSNRLGVNLEKLIVYNYKTGEIYLNIDSKHADVEIYLKRAMSYVDLKKYNEAILELNKAIKLKPDYVEAYAWRGYAYDQLDQYQQAIVDYDKTISLKPDAAAYSNRGADYYRLGQYQRAIVDLDKAIELKPQIGIPYYYKSCAFSLMGDELNACKYLKLSIEKGFKEWEIIKKSKAMDKIRNSACYREIMSDK